MMVYDVAYQQFQENVDLGDRGRDPQSWNLNAGLGNLTEALSEDLADIKSILESISARLSRIEAKSQ